jgi:hypothetical protein
MDGETKRLGAREVADARDILKKPSEENMIIT